MAWQIAFLLDANTPVNVGVGLMPIWALSTEERRTYPSEWRASWNSMWNPEPGYTLINTESNGDLVEWAMSLVPTIEELHPQLFCLHLYGIEHSNRFSEET